MPTIVCQSCGTRQEIAIFEKDPECQNCGASDFSPATASP